MTAAEAAAEEVTERLNADVAKLEVLAVFLGLSEVKASLRRMDLGEKQLCVSGEGACGGILVPLLGHVT